MNRIERAIVARAVLDETDVWALERLRAQRAWLSDPACNRGFLGLDPERTRALLDGYAAQMELEDEDQEDGAQAWGCFSDHHVWPQEEVYLRGNDAAQRYIPSGPLRPFAEAWSEPVGAGAGEDSWGCSSPMGFACSTDCGSDPTE